jgi:hypothetical protein
MEMLKESVSTIAHKPSAWARLLIFEVFKSASYSTLVSKERIIQ